jgi:hypothetical protein
MGQKTFTQFRVDNIVTTLPTTLEYGKEVYYKDASGNLTLWVGHEDGSAWPAVGYKEFTASISGTTVTVIKNDLSETPTATASGSGTTLTFASNQWVVATVQLLPFSGGGSQVALASLAGTQFTFVTASLEGNPSLNRRVIRLSSIGVNVGAGTMTQSDFAGTITIIVPSQ